VALWSSLLHAIPRSRLAIVTIPEGDARKRMAASFARHGIGEDRLEFHGRLRTRQFHELHQQVDIALDPFPVNGGTTTCGTLWMGVPVLTLIGDRFLARAGLSLLTAAGLTDFAVPTAEDFIRFAIHLSENLPLLAEIRAGLREHIAASPLMDEAGFTRNLENIYRAAWEKWCIQTSPLSNPLDKHWDSR